MKQVVVQQHLVVLEFNITITVGPAVQAKGFGWGLGSWGGEDAGAVTTTLNGAINAAVTSITVADASQFPDSGTNFIIIGFRRNILYRY